MYWKECRSGIYNDKDLIELGEHVCSVWKWRGKKNLKLLLFAFNSFSEIGYVFCWQHRPRLRQGFSEFIHIKIVQWINQRHNLKGFLSNYLKKLKALAKKKKKKKVKSFYICSSSLYGHNNMVGVLIIKYEPKILLASSWPWLFLYFFFIFWLCYGLSLA